ncbi:MAG: alpha/beta fold hydrolase [Rhodospirillales bacterium]|nr:alpha/beta fold hydrolase [Rhodospirillales bacterium]
MRLLTIDDAEIYYEEFGVGYPVLLFAPGGMRSRLELWHAPAGGPPRSWVDWTAELAKDYRVIALDQRNAGQSRGAVEAGHGWQTYAADHLALLDHLGVERCHVLGGCIGSSFCLTLCDVASDRISAAVLQNPVGLHPEFSGYFPDGFAAWSAELLAERPELDREAVQSFGRNMWGGDFTFNVTRDFVRSCETPALVLPGNDTPHPRVIGLELAELLPKSEILMDWKGPDHLEEQRRRVVDFLAAHTPN